MMRSMYHCDSQNQTNEQQQKQFLSSPGQGMGTGRSRMMRSMYHCSQNKKQATLTERAHPAKGWAPAGRG